MAEKENRYRVLDQANTDDMKVLSDEIKDFIKAQKLFQNIQGKEYVNVEGWMYAGSRLGLTSYTEDVWDISTADEVKYKAKVVVERLEDGRRVGQGFAVCSNKEQGKKYYQEYAILSMAQTRGVSKAYRLFLAQLMRMAGFEPTPAEEMDGYDSATPSAAPAKPAKAPAAKPAAPDQEAPAANVKYASASQKEKIIRLLNNPVITKQEKTKMLLNINRFDEERAQQTIEKLNAIISEREGGQETSDGDEAAANGNGVHQPTAMTAQQKKKLLELLDHEKITDAERAKMKVALTKFDADRAAEATGKLKATIQERGGVLK